MWDKNNNGQIDDGNELFGNGSLLQNEQRGSNGFAALAEQDSNHDGQVNAQDAHFNDLRIWQDKNGDGVVQAGELFTLAQKHVKSLSTAYVDQGSLPDGSFYPHTDEGIDANGNQHRQVGSYTTTDNQTYRIDDVWFKVAPQYTVDKGIQALTAEIAGLPNLTGFGRVQDLQQALLNDQSGRLKTLLLQFMQAEHSADRQAVMNELIYRWAGVINVDPSSRSTAMFNGNSIGDARKLAANQPHFEITTSRSIQIKTYHAMTA